MSLNTSLRATFVIANRAVVVVGIIVLPLVLTQHWIICRWCDKVYFLDNLPIFDALLKHDQITISNLCLLELACVVILFFRIFYVSLEHESIIDDRVSRIRSFGRKPRRELIRGIILGIVLVLGWFADSFLPVSWDFISAHGPSTVAMFFMLWAVVVFYALPEIAVYILYITTKKLDTH